MNHKMREVKELVEKGWYDEKLSKTILQALDKAVSNKQPMLLYGPPGIGKTLGVYYHAHKHGFNVIEYNASDELRTEENQASLLSKIRTRYRKVTYILLDELDVDGLGSGKKNYLKFLCKLLILNKQTSMKTKAIIIGVTNHEYELGRTKVKLKAKRSVSKLGRSVKDKYTDVVSEFAFKTKCYRPYEDSIKRYFKKVNVTIPKKIKKDLRAVNQHLKRPVKKMTSVNEYKNSFDMFQDFINSNMEDRDIRKIPSPRDLSSSLWKWLIVNGFDENLDSFLKRNTWEFYHTMKTISLAESWNNDKLYAFLPDTLFAKSFVNFKHPSTILKSVKETDQS